MKKIVIFILTSSLTALLCAMMSSCGGTKILSLYDTTFTYTGETLPLEWNKSMGTVWFETDSHKESVKQLLIKHWNEVDWEITKNYWNELMVSLGKNNDVTQGINDKTTSSVDEFINYFNLIGNNFYSKLKDVSITVGSKSEKVDVTLHALNKSDVTYECYSLGENAVGKEYPNDFGISQISFSTAKIAEYDALYFSVPSQDFGADTTEPTVAYPIELICLIAIKTV